jgi:hypothetical protein
MTRVVIHRDKSALLLLAICALIGLALAVLPGCATDTGNASTGGIQRIVSAYAGPEVANVVAEKFAAVAPATPAQAAITSNIIGSALQTAANQLAE